jgi:hypothetical protein
MIVGTTCDLDADSGYKDANMLSIYSLIGRGGSRSRFYQAFSIMEGQHFRGRHTPDRQARLQPRGELKPLSLTIRVAGRLF